LGGRWPTRRCSRRACRSLRSLWRPQLNAGTLARRAVMTTRLLGWLALTISAVVACAKAESTALPSLSRSGGACACQPESPDTGRESLECFCRHGDCPDSLDLAIERLSKDRQRDRDASLVRSEGCGLSAITLTNGLFTETFRYDDASRGLVGASFAGDLCAGPCSCSIVAGRSACPNAKACLMSGPNIQRIPRCDSEASRPTTGMVKRDFE